MASIPADQNTALHVLRKSTFGRRTAEEEREQLRQYFVETNQWSKVFNGEVDVVYGPKGSGKSAIYSLISQNSDALFDRNIIVVTGENPQGAPAFRDLNDDPPYDEFEFVSLWKLYILTLCGQAIKDYGIGGLKAASVVRSLEEADLIPGNFTLAKALRYAFDYVRQFTRAEAYEAEIKLDPITGIPAGVAGRIVLREPGAAAAKAGIVSIDDLFRDASQALEDAGYTIWVVLDRLDVAFADKPGLETSALRALFKFYLDTKSHRSISTKIFLRTDIWAAITREGFREASHIERSLDIKWSPEDLTNLVARRAMANEDICKFYAVNPQAILADYASQEAFLGRLFPEQVETGPNKPKTFSWILGRTRDSLEPTAPRELIHFLNELRDVQVNRLERGEKTLAQGKLFEQLAFKEALPAVSKVRLEQTLFAEYPTLKPLVEALSEQKATQPVSNLAILWQLEKAEAFKAATQLEEVGFFERIAAAQEPTWRVPFLYRPALALVQGSAEGEQ
jgi:hypothetical protein